MGELLLGPRYRPRNPRQRFTFVSPQKYEKVGIRFVPALLGYNSLMLLLTSFAKLAEISAKRANVTEPTKPPIKVSIASVLCPSATKTSADTIATMQIIPARKNANDETKLLACLGPFRTKAGVSVFFATVSLA